jgi:hypothetical protein
MSLDVRDMSRNVRDTLSESFTKLFSSILCSSIWSESDQTRIVWITMLAMADRDGYVGASVIGLARLAGVPIEDAKRAIDKFLAPDENSRSKEHEGRRIEVADRGWNILNYSRFRNMRDEESRRSYERERKRMSREMSRMSRTVPDIPLLSAQAEAEAKSSTSVLSESPVHAKASDKDTTRRVKRGAAVERPDEVAEQVWQDFLAVRKAKKSPVTATAVARLRKEASKAGWTLERVLTECAARGWQGFNADWVKDAAAKNGRIEFSTDPDLPCDEWGFPLSVGGRG